MKAKNVLIVLMILTVSVFFSACTTGVIDPDRTPKPKTLTVDYMRVLPVPLPEAGDGASLNWEYGSYQGGTAVMTKVSDDTFVANGVSIMTETVIRISVNDPRMWTGVSLEVCKFLEVDGQALETNSTYGQTTFIYGNDGKVRKPGG